MKESVLHYIWQHKLFMPHDMKTTDGIPVEVIDTGKINYDAGPDFFNAKIRIGTTIWAGNIEIHLSSSDWYRHHHERDAAYKNVILHVVKHADVPVFLNDGSPLPQMELPYAATIDLNYDELIRNTSPIACAGRLHQVSSFWLNDWKTALLTERLEHKVHKITNQLQNNAFHWEETFFRLLSRSMGFSINSDAFEALAETLPWILIRKIRDQLFRLEALLFGQSGLLQIAPTDNYVEQLRDEYYFLQNKFQLQPMSVERWRLLRLRPENFPHLRIAQLAAILHQRDFLFSEIVAKPSLKFVMQVFSVNSLSYYWSKHFLLGVPSVEQNKQLGSSSVHSIIINAVVPMLFCYSTQFGDEALRDKSLQLLDEMPAENNKLVRLWKSLGLQVNKASDSQSLIQLYIRYCDVKDCLRCRIGHRVLTLK